MIFYDVPLVVDLEVESDQVEFDLEIENDIFEFDLETDQTIVINKIRADEYTGATTVVPSPFQQILETTDKLLVTDIIVEPIPSNYGLITWNGSVLTVS